jgi:hypothetical protein
LETIWTPKLFRGHIDHAIDKFPELFPCQIVQGYAMKDIRKSAKLNIPIRRIEIDGVAYTIHPSFVMPYLVGIVEGDIEKALFLRKFNVPFWALTYVFGRNPMYWHRMEAGLGRNSIVGTTIADADWLPEHVAADEKHSWLRGEKCYVATTVGAGCILGAAVAEDAGEEALTRAYRVFKEEAQCIKPDYAPATANTDGWSATQKAWKALFVSVVLIACFLHVYIKIRDRSKKKFRDLFHQTSTKLWECYEAATRESFLERVKTLVEWTQGASLPGVILDPIQKFSDGAESFAVAYDFPGAHRTSNMLDRLMQRMDRHLFATGYFHGLSVASASLSIRGWVLIQNFAPWNRRTIHKNRGWKSPAEKLNQRRYHDCWLENLLISASLRGHRAPPPNP